MQTENKKIQMIGYYLRFITPLFVGISLFVLQSIANDIREVRSDISSIKKEVIFKCDYYKDLEYTRICLERLEKKLND